jgi:hypothetical protein
MKMCQFGLINTPAHRSVSTLAAVIVVSDGIVLTMGPLANCQRYDYLLGSINVH